MCYNWLLRVMRSFLPLFRKVLKGVVVMSDDLEALGTAFFSNKVPDN